MEVYLQCAQVIHIFLSIQGNSYIQIRDDCKNTVNQINLKHSIKPSLEILR